MVEYLPTHTDLHHPYNVILTKDGSPTLTDLKTNEPMHNLHGAFNESLYLYLEALKKLLPTDILSIISVGLGLAYNEIISIAYLEQQKINSFKITSYEKNKNLTTAIKQWCSSQTTNPQNALLFSSYEIILNLSAKKFGLEKKILKYKLKEAITLKKWIFCEELNQETTFSEKYNCVFYDAFSEKTSPDLWSKDHLKRFIQLACQNYCIFSTYAAKGSLNRALKDARFTLKKRTGFGKKNESTLAIRT